MLRGRRSSLAASPQNHWRVASVHVADGFLNGPACAGSAVVAAGALLAAMRRIESSAAERMIPYLGVMSATIFAAQTVKFPVLAGASGHLAGGALAALVLGPSAAVVCMSAVLILQCLLFYDGGITALGANVTNLGVIAPVTAYLAFQALRGWWGVPVKAAVFVSSWLSVVVAAAACGLELAFSGTFPASVVVPAMVIVHALIGVGEGLITVLTIGFLLQVRPDLVAIANVRPVGLARPWLWTATGLAAALSVAFFLSPLAAETPDGLEYVTAQLGEGNGENLAPRSALLADYQVPGVAPTWLSTALASAAGTLGVFAAAAVIGRAVRPGKRADDGDRDRTAD